jgi:hypothetical protein
VPYLDCFSAKFKDSCLNLLRYVTKISPLANSCIAKDVLVAMHVPSVCSITFWAVVATVQTFAIYNPPSSPLAKKKNLQVKIFTTYAVSYMSCVGTLAISHT